eukprot:gene29966-52040_t
MRARSIRPSDDSPFVNEVFNVDFTDYVYSRPSEERAALLEEVAQTNYAVADLDLIQQIYAAAYDPTKWVGVMEKLSDAVGGLRGCLTRIDLETGAGVEAILMRSDPAWVDAYAQHFGDVNVFKLTRGQNDPYADVQPVATDEDCLSRDDYARSEYYNDFMRPQDVDRSLFIRLGRSGTVASTINIGRRTGEEFDQSDLDFAARLQPHLVRAHELSRQIAQPLGVIRHLAEALQHSPHALFLVDAD